MDFFFCSELCDACQQDNGGRTAAAAAKEILCPDPSSRKRERREQRPPMWLKLNVYHEQVQWVTYFQECSFIRLKIYYPRLPSQPSTSPHLFFFVFLGRCEAGACTAFLFFQCGGRKLVSLQRHVFLILGPFAWKLL